MSNLEAFPHALFWNGCLERNDVIPTSLVSRSLEGDRSSDQCFLFSVRICTDTISGTFPFLHRTMCYLHYHDFQAVIVFLCHAFALRYTTITAALITVAVPYYLLLFHTYWSTSLRKKSRINERFGNLSGTRLQEAFVWLYLYPLRRASEAEQVSLKQQLQGKKFKPLILSNCTNSNSGI
jgi:hypothetical protein